MKGYKAFNLDMTCNDFQFEEGKTYIFPDQIGLCVRGFHFCRNPLDLFNYYDITNCVFHEVTSPPKAGRIESTTDSKVVTNILKIGKRLSLKELILKVKKSKFKTKLKSQTIQTECYCNIAQLEDEEIYQREENKIVQTNYNCNIAQVNIYNTAAQLSYLCSIFQLGVHNRLVQFNSDCKAVQHGDFNKAVQLDNNCSMELKGKNCVGISIGKNSRIKGTLNSWITLAEYDGDYVILVKTAKVDGKEIEADTWYTLKDGEFVKL